MDQPQQSNRDLSPLCQLSKAAPHYLATAVTPVLSEERQIRTLEWRAPLPSPLPTTFLQTPISACIPVPATFRGLLPVGLCAEVPLGALGTLGAQSGSAPCSLPKGRSSLNDPLWTTPSLPPKPPGKEWSAPGGGGAPPAVGRQTGVHRFKTAAP